MKPLCTTRQDSYIITYPEAVAYAEAQFSIAWPPKEFPVEDDMHEFLTVATEADKHAVTTILKLFTKYEQVVGNEYWGNRIAKKYQRPCIQRMANAFAYAELNMHAPFYNELNKVLHLDTEEFYTSYVNDPILLARMEFITEYVSSKDDLLSLAVFSIVEGAVLYSAFAFLKHYQNGGKNLFKNLMSGINSSVRDENLHAEGGAWLYRTHMSELGLTDEKKAVLEAKIVEAAKTVFAHEEQIIEMVFGGGTIEGITKKQMQYFVQSRINICLKGLDIDPIFTVTYNPVAEWFYDAINAVKIHDFFNTTGNEYHRNWTEEKFIWK